MHTNAVLLVQIDVQDSLQTMLEGSYKSGEYKQLSFNHGTTLLFLVKVALPSDPLDVIRRSRVQILLPATRCGCNFKGNTWL